MEEIYIIRIVNNFFFKDFKETYKWASSWEEVEDFIEQELDKATGEISQYPNEMVHEFKKDQVVEEGHPRFRFIARGLIYRFYDIFKAPSV